MWQARLLSPASPHCRWLNICPARCVVLAGSPLHTDNTRDSSTPRQRMHSLCSWCCPRSHQLYRGDGPHASLLCTLVCLRSDGDFELNFLMEGEGDGRGEGPPAAGPGESHACMRGDASGCRQVSPGEPVDFESGLPPPPLETTRTASHAQRSRFGARAALCVPWAIMCCASCHVPYIN